MKGNLICLQFGAIAGVSLGLLVQGDPVAQLAAAIALSIVLCSGAAWWYTVSR